MSYQVLPYKEFGRHLLKSKDLDPVYVMLHKAGLDRDQLSRWCLAYWSFYHVGVASRIAEASPRSFYRLMMKAHNEKWPRGAERRHFRGGSSLRAIEFMRKFGPPSTVVEYMLSDRTFDGITHNVKEFPVFGPWIAFKIADMASTVLAEDVDYSGCTLGIYKDPRQGAALLKHGDWRAKISDEELEQVVSTLAKEFRRYTAPPLHNRKVGIMEVETILCKYKSHYKGSYPLFKDSKEVWEALHEWGDLAESMKCLVPNNDKWS